MNNKFAYNFAIVGATGMVGSSFLRVLEERKLPIAKLFLFASQRSAGKVINFMGGDYEVKELTEDSFIGLDIDIALFSAGGSTSEKFAPIAAKSGAVVIDNSSFWRMDSDVPLIVPEVNADRIADYTNKNIIANPNCSTIQAMPVLSVLRDNFGLKRVVYSTYQAVSGAGFGGYTDLKNGVSGDEAKKFPHQIAFNCIPQIDVFLDNGYTKEEQKMIDETKKILELPDLAVTATAVRVPVFNGHCASVNVELNTDFDIENVKTLLAAAPGVVLVDDPKNNLYPMPITASGKDEVFVGRIRRDRSVKNGIDLFVAADNIRKGAATNAVQIAEELIRFWQKA